MIGCIFVECVIEYLDLKKVGRDMKVVIYWYKRMIKIFFSDICFLQYNDRNSVFLCNQYIVYCSNRFVLIIYLIVLFFLIEFIEILKIKECCKKCGVLIEKFWIDFYMRNVYGFVEQCQLCYIYFDMYDQLLDYVIFCYLFVENSFLYFVDLFVDNVCKVCGYFVEFINKLEYL